MPETKYLFLAMTGGTKHCSKNQINPFSPAGKSVGSGLEEILMQHLKCYGDPNVERQWPLNSFTAQRIISS